MALKVTISSRALENSIRYNCAFCEQERCYVFATTEFNYKSRTFLINIAISNATKPCAITMRFQRDHL